MSDKKNIKSTCSSNIMANVRFKNILQYFEFTDSTGLYYIMFAHNSVVDATRCYVDNGI